MDHMAMSFTKEKAMIWTKIATVIFLSASLGGCTYSSLRISPDFGNAVHQDVAAQIADPDAHYRGAPQPGSNGARTGLAQKRYEANQVIAPSSTTASSAASIGRADNGSANNGAGPSVGMGASQ
jgi:hypothetical protein